EAIQGISQELDWLDGHDYIRIDINGKLITPRRSCCSFPDMLGWDVRVLLQGRPARVQGELDGLRDVVTAFEQARGGLVLEFVETQCRRTRRLSVRVTLAPTGLGL
ncbi:MAG TPA: hypothetical protein VGE19_09065, partial [Pseudoxanthomonas sp.]